MVATPPPPPLMPADPPAAAPALTAVRSLAVTPFLGGFLQGAFSVFVVHYGQRRAARRAAAATVAVDPIPSTIGDDPLRDGLSAAVVSSAGGGVGGGGGTAAAPAAGVSLVE